MHVADVALVPLAKEEARQVLGSDYLVSALLDDDGATRLHLRRNGWKGFPWL